MSYKFLISVFVVSVIACGYSYNNDRKLASSESIASYFDNQDDGTHLKQFYFVQNHDTSYLSLDVIYDLVGIRTITLSQNSVCQTEKFSRIDDMYLEPKPLNIQKNRFYLSYSDIKSLVSNSYFELEKLGFSDHVTLCFQLSSLADMSAIIYKQYETEAHDSINSDTLISIILKSEWMIFLRELFAQKNIIVSNLELGDLGCVGDDFYTNNVFQQVDPSELSNQLIDSMVYVSLSHEPI